MAISYEVMASNNIYLSHAGHLDLLVLWSWCGNAILVPIRHARIRHFFDQKIRAHWLEAHLFPFAPPAVCNLMTTPYFKIHISGMWHSGSASALHAESPGFDSPHLHDVIFEWSRVRLTLGACYALIAQW